MGAAKRLLKEYLSALNSKNIDAIEQMSSSHSRLEIPFIKPNRLLGNTEIVEAHREIFIHLEFIDFQLSSTESSDSHAIGA